MFITFLYVLKTLQLLDDKVFKSTDLIFTQSWKCQAGVRLIFLGPKSAVVIGTRANKGQGMFLGFSRRSWVEEDWMTRPKNVCIGGYHAYRREMMVVVSCNHNQSLVYLLANCDKVIKHGISAVSVFSHKVTATIVVSQKFKTVAVFVSQTNPVVVEPIRDKNKGI